MPRSPRRDASEDVWWVESRGYNEEQKRRLSVLQAKHKLPEVLEYFGLEYNVPGVGYRKVRCPFHDDRNPSASVSDTYFHCFACEVHGDAIDLVMEQLGLDFNEALDFIGNL